MKAPFPCFLILLAAILIPAPAWPNSVARVAIQEMEQDDVLRIANYLGAEQTGRRILVRTRPEAYDGLYYRFIFEDSLESFPSNATLAFSLLRDEKPDPVTYEMPLPEFRPNGRELWLGLTGEDWILGNDTIFPTAWKLTIRGADGSILVEERSFVWGNR